MIQVYQDIVQPVVRFPWEWTRQHEPSRHFVAADDSRLRLLSAVGDRPMTWWQWFYPKTDHQAFLQKIGIEGDIDTFEVLYRTDDTLRCRQRATGGFQDAETSNSVVVGQWNNFFVTWTSTDTDVRLNGGPNDNQPISVNPEGLNQTSIGGGSSDATSGNMFDGRIMWACFWNVILNDAERLRLQSGVPPWYIRPESILACPDMKSLRDPFLNKSWINSNGTTTSNPYRDWSLPDETAQFMIPPPHVHRSITLATNLAVADGSKYRVRIQQIKGTEAPTLVADASSFNISK